MIDDYEEERSFDDQEESGMEWGCLFPSECCMPGEHITSECHTAEMAHGLQVEAETHEFDQWWQKEGHRWPIVRGMALEVWIAARVGSLR